MGKLFLVVFISSMLTLVAQVTNAYPNGEKRSSKIIKKIKKTYKAFRKDASYLIANGEKLTRRIRFIQPEDNVIENYDNLRQIALIRHGEPDLVKTGKFSRDQAMDFMVCYDTVCIIQPQDPFFILEEKEEVKIFSSPLNRALSTAHFILGSDKEIDISPDFREFDTNIKNKGHKMRMPIKYWTTTARIKWMLGFKTEGKESFSQAKKRAARAAQTLSDSSVDDPKILLFAHGMLNHFVRKELEKMGWKVVEETGNDYFGTSILVKIN